LVALMGVAALSGCTPAPETVVVTRLIEPGQHRLVLETSSWESMDPETLEERDSPLAARHAASLCADGHSIKLEEQRTTACDWVCDNSKPSAFSSTLWIVTCYSAGVPE
jgi:hypothetical protein